MGYSFPFDPEKMYTWVKYIKDRITNNKNFLGIFTGPTGVGKSFSALTLSCMIDPEFDITRVVFKARDMLALINEPDRLKSGSVIVWDESGVDLSAKEWYSVTNKVINIVLQSFRHRNIILLFTTPYSDFIDNSSRKLIHAEFQVRSINRKTNETNINAILWQYNSHKQKMYYHHLYPWKIVNGRRRRRELKIFALCKPHPELIALYEAKRHQFTKELNKGCLSDLDKLEPVEKKEDVINLTDKQQVVLDGLKAGKLPQEMADEQGVSIQNIYYLIKRIKAKGIFVVPGKTDGDTKYYVGEPESENEVKDIKSQ